MGLIAVCQLWSMLLRRRWSGHNDVVNLVQDSIGGDQIAFCNSGIFDLGTAVTSDAQMLARNRFDRAYKWPVGGYDASTADNIVDNVRLDLSFEFGLALGRLALAGHAELFEHIILGHKKRETIRFIGQHLGQIGLAHQLQELAVVGISFQRIEQILSGRAEQK